MSSGQSEEQRGVFLVVQRPGLHASTAEGTVQSLVRELSSPLATRHSQKKNVYIK